tara:strand:+ start:4502 stop:6310 length:1809 start_codon:yes stop_codon:yes gene_type:complete
MHSNRTEIIFEIANSHNGNFRLLKETVKQFTNINYKNKSLKFQIFKYDYLSCKNFNWYKVYKKLFFSKSQWGKILNFCIKKKIKVYLDIYDEYGIYFLNKFKKNIKGIKIQYSSINNYKIIDYLKDNNDKQLEIIINVTTLSLKEIKKLYSEIKEISKNITLQFGHQDYPTSFSNSGFNKIKFLKKNFKNSKISFADHLDSKSEESKSFFYISRLLKIDQIEKHFCLSRKLSKYDYYSSLELREINNIIKSKIGDTKIKKINKILRKIYNKNFILQYEKKLIKNIATPHYSKNIKKNEILNKKNIDLKRCKTKSSFNLKELDKKLFKIKKKVNINQPVKKSDLKKLNIGAIIISRSDSSRLKNKAFLKIGNLTSIEHCIKNTQKMKYLDNVILATTNQSIDKEYLKYTSKNGAKIFFGDSTNVISRVYLAAKKNKLDTIVRITGDCPFISKEILEELLINHLNSNSDFTVANKFPIGASGEIINFKALEKLYFYIKKQKDFKYTEYPSFYFKNNPELFNYNVCTINSKYQKNFRLTLDYKEDLKMLRLLDQRLKKLKMANNIDNIIKVIEKYKNISKTNSHKKVVYKSENFIKKMKKISKII